MSWSITSIGNPVNVAKELDEESARLTGQCKVEFDAALPHLKAIVLENFQTRPAPYCQPVVKLEASGHGSASGAGADLIQVERNCMVKIESHYAKLV